MTPLAIVKAFNPFRYRICCLFLADPRLLMNQFLFKASDERFRHTVVPAIALSAHALDNISSSEKSSEFVACVLHSLVAVNMFSTEVIVANCLDHGRRKFFDIKASFTEECDYVLNEMQKVYRFDKETRAMTPKGRLEYHAEHGAPIMESLRLWMKDQIEGKKAEPNSPLGKAISYNLKRWKELTTFLRVGGAPLSNAEA